MQMTIPVHVGGRGLDYELLDSGGFEKLERFGSYVLRRPEPQAMWPRALGENEWDRRTQARYERQKTSHYRDAEDTGKWALAAGVKEPWFIDYKHEDLKLKFKLGFTAFKHVGIFPEQTVNWEWIYRFASSMPGCRVLNLFAYTGGASLVAKAAGADVVHLDAVRGMINWARENMELSGLSDIRWVVEDAAKFVEREAKRRRTYDLIIMDPPAYGRGPAGEKWVLEKDLPPLLATAQTLLSDRGKILLNLYSLNHSALLVRNFGSTAQHWGESVLQDAHGRFLPLGVFGCPAGKAPR